MIKPNLFKRLYGLDGLNERRSNNQNAYILGDSPIFPNIISFSFGIQYSNITCNTQESLVLINGMEHMIDLPLALSHACIFSNNLYRT